MATLTQEQKDNIQKEYLAITDFSNGALGKLAAKHNMETSELLDVITL